MSNGFEEIELAEAVRAIRTGLTAAAAAGAGEDLAFDVGDIALEFTVELRRDAKAGGKVKAWIVEGGTDVSRGSARTHRVAFTLTPKDRRTGDGWKVGNDRPAGLSGFGSAGTEQ
ncbi:trypco2 family protein [Streptomyces sp. NPDC053079]|uniref:trypco2 family protein n=1 Tax=Streptomyces sp. NPDC053079 TaxID=3365697 RepID=UPI0037D55A58